MQLNICYWTSSLKNIELSHNRIDDKGCEALQKFLSLASVEEIDLSSNMLKAKTGIALIDAIK